MPEPRPPSATKQRLLRAGVVIGVLMVVVPFLTAMVGIHEAAFGVTEGGLRGATHRVDKKEQVSFALSSTSVMAFFAPAGAVLGVLCGLSLVGDKRKRDPEPSREEY